MSICPDCQRDVTGLNRCPCGALVGTVARRPAPHQPSLPACRGNADVTAYKEFLKRGFPEPSRAWAHDLLARVERGERLLLCQIASAVAAVATEHISDREREYVPGEDRDDDEGVTA